MNKGTPQWIGIVAKYADGSSEGWEFTDVYSYLVGSGTHLGGSLNAFMRKQPGPLEIKLSGFADVWSDMTYEPPKTLKATNVRSFVAGPIQRATAIEGEVEE